MKVPNGIIGVAGPLEFQGASEKGLRKAKEELGGIHSGSIPDAKGEAVCFGEMTDRLV
jgi:hypothetical protein